MGVWPKCKKAESRSSFSASDKGTQRSFFGHHHYVSDERWSSSAIYRATLALPRSDGSLLPRHQGVLCIGMILATVGEMLNFPFMNRFGYDRADHGPQGA